MKKMTKAMLMTALILGSVSMGTAVEASELHEFTLDPMVVTAQRMEMRDLDTISTAITAAETGHLVFSTLHTIGASATIDRIIDVFPPHQQQQIRTQLGFVLEAVISQQLIHKDGEAGRVAAF